MNKKDATAIAAIITFRIEGGEQPDPNTLARIIRDIIYLDDRISAEISLFDNGESILNGFGVKK